MQIQNLFTRKGSKKSLSPANIIKDNGLSGYSFFTFTGSDLIPGFTINLQKYSGLKKAYYECSPVSTIINRLATSMANGKWWIVDSSDNNVVSKYKNVEKILSRPNPFQSFPELIIQMDVYRSLFGEVYLYAPSPVGFDPESIYVLNPINISPIINKNASILDSKDEIIQRYKYKSGIFSSLLIDAKDVIHIKDVFQNLDDDSIINGKSRLAPLGYEVKNICQAQEAIYSLNKDRGAQGILSNKKKDAAGSAPLTDDEKKELHEYYNINYGLKKSQSKIIITEADVQWQQMSFNVKELMLFEGIKQNIESIADAYNYPFELLANSKGTTYNNKNEAKKSLYQDATLPTASIYEEAFTHFFNLQEGDRFQIDFSDVECMQEAEKEKSGAKRLKNQANEIAYRNGIITLEEWREDLGMDQKFNGDTFYNSEDQIK